LCRRDRPRGNDLPVSALYKWTATIIEIWADLLQRPKIAGIGAMATWR
jgi:hypothetical protein